MRTLLARLTFTVGMIGLFAGPAFANHVNHAIAGASCVGYGIFVDGSELNNPRSDLHRRLSNRPRASVRSQHQC